jgi:hypothetical protein
MRKIDQAINFVAGVKIGHIRRHPLYHARDLVPRYARDPRRSIGVLITGIPG